MDYNEPKKGNKLAKLPGVKSQLERQIERHKIKQGHVKVPKIGEREEALNLQLKKIGAAPVPGPTLKAVQKEALYNQWARKLADSGFQDLEAASWTIPELQDNRYNGCDIKVEFRPEHNEALLRYFQAWTCYMAYEGHKLDRFTRYICEQYSEGISYRQIVKQIKMRFAFYTNLTPGSETWKELKVHASNRKPPHLKCNLTYVFKVLKKIRPLVIEWNKSDERGMLWEPDEVAGMG